MRRPAWLDGARELAEDPPLLRTVLTPAQRYTAVLTIALGGSMLLLGMPEHVPSSPSFATQPTAAATAGLVQAPRPPDPAFLATPPTVATDPVAPAEPPPSTTTTQPAPPPSEPPSTQPPTTQPPEDDPVLPLPPLPLP